MSVRTDFSLFPSISAINSFSVTCEAVCIKGAPVRASYCVCQHTILAFKEARLPAGSFSDCADAIKEGRCKAVKMMLEEVRQQKPVYFINALEEIAAIEATNRKPSSFLKRGKGFEPVFAHKKTVKSTVAPAPEFEGIGDVYRELVKAELKNAE